MKKFITYLFLGAFIFHATSRLFVYVNHFINQEYIAENLCENRDEPKLNCNGKCHLKKELKKNEKHKQQERKNQIETFLFIVPKNEYEVHLKRILSITKVYASAVSAQNTTEFISSIFRPPIVV